MTKILIVDDVKLFRHLESSVLRWRGYTIQEAASGAEALEKIRSDRPDLAIVDLYMPGMQGTEVCQRIKSDPDLASIPVIIVTTSSREEDIRKAIQAGCDDYLTKPLDDTTLLRKVEELLGQVNQRGFPRVGASLQISFEDFKGIFFGFTRDISQSGVFIEMADPLPEGSRLCLSFSLPEPFVHPVKVFGVVVRTEQHKNPHRSGIGVRFICLEEDSKDTIDRLVQQAQAECLVAGSIFSRITLQSDPQILKDGPKLDQALHFAASELSKLRSAHERLEQEYLQLSARLTLINALHEDRSAAELVEVVFDVLRDLVGISACALLIHVPKSGRFQIGRARGVSPALVEQWIGGQGSNPSLEEPALRILNPTETHVGGQLKLQGTVPVFYQGTRLALLTLHDLFFQKRQLNQGDRDLLEVLSKQFGIALQRACARRETSSCLFDSAALLACLSRPISS